MQFQSLGAMISKSQAEQVWLQSAGLRFFAEGQWHGTSGKNATMSQVSRQHYTSSDELGNFSCVNISWSVATRQGLLIHTSFKTYLESCMVILIQEIPPGVQGSNASKAVMPEDGHELEEGAHPPILSFPSFGVGELEKLGFLTWKGVFAKAIYGKALAQHLAGLSSNGPVVLFNRAFNTLVVSPLDHFKSAVHTFNADANAWDTGVSSEIQSLPKGFYHRTLIMARVGITQAMDEYGQTIRKLYSTKRPLQRKDPVVNYLSYWTDAWLILSQVLLFLLAELNQFTTVLLEYECCNLYVSMAIGAVLQSHSSYFES